VTLIGVSCPRTAAEILALDVLARHNFEPVNREQVAAPSRRVGWASAGLLVRPL
jgi:hypothetical protein